MKTTTAIFFYDNKDEEETIMSLHEVSAIDISVGDIVYLSDTKHDRMGKETEVVRGDWKVLKVEKCFEVRNHQHATYSEIYINVYVEKVK
jgi:hypothetical protein